MRVVRARCGQMQIMLLSVSACYQIYVVVIAYRYVVLNLCHLKKYNMHHGKSCVDLQFFTFYICCRLQIAAYPVNVDPEAQEKIQKRAERFKSSLMPQRSAATSILNSIHAMVRITTF